MSGDRRIHEEWRAQGGAGGFDEIVVSGAFHIERMNANCFFVEMGGFRGSLVREKVDDPWRLVFEGSGEDVGDGWPKPDRGRLGR